MIGRVATVHSLRPCGGECRRDVRLPPGVRGYYPREYFDILNARMCILERTQRRIGTVDEKQIIAAEHIIIVIEIMGAFCIACLTLKVEEATAPATSPSHLPTSRLRRRQCPVCGRPLQSGVRGITSGKILTF